MANRRTWAGKRTAQQRAGVTCGFFIFIFYIFFLQKYILDLKIYRNMPRPPSCRAAGTWPPGSGRQGLLCKSFCSNICGRLAAGRPAPLATRQRGGRPWPPAAGGPALPPLYKGWLVSPPLICITKIPETKKKERGRERGEALLDFRAGDCR